MNATRQRFERVVPDVIMKLTNEDQRRQVNKAIARYRYADRSDTVWTKEVTAGEPILLWSIFHV